MPDAAMGTMDKEERSLYQIDYENKLNYCLKLYNAIDGNLKQKLN